MLHTDPISVVLPAPFGSEQAEERAVGEFQVEVGHRGDAVAVDLAQSLDRQGRWARSISRIAAELVGRHRQSVVVAQGGARVVLAEQSLASQDRQHVLDEGLQSGRQRRAP